MYRINHLIWLFAILCIDLWNVSCMGHGIKYNQELTTTIILIRHAERDNFFILTEKGKKRAAALVQAVQAMDVKAIFSPDLERNLDTVQPLANQLGLDITLTPRIDETTMDQIVNLILTKHAGEVSLLVGNGSGNLRDLHNRLGGLGDGPYKYGDLFIYEFKGQRPVKVTRSRFGS